jgi:hypothetical protein
VSDTPNALFESLPDSLINHVLASHDQQEVSDTALFLCQAVIIDHSCLTVPFEQAVSDSALFFPQAV